MDVLCECHRLALSQQQCLEEGRSASENRDAVCDASKRHAIPGRACCNLRGKKTPLYFPTFQASMTWGREGSFSFNYTNIQIVPSHGPQNNLTNSINQFATMSETSLQVHSPRTRSVMATASELAVFTAFNPLGQRFICTSSLDQVLRYLRESSRLPSSVDKSLV